MAENKNIGMLVGIIIAIVVVAAGIILLIVYLVIPSSSLAFSSRHFSSSSSASASSAPPPPPFVTGDVVTLKADFGGYLSSCFACVQGPGVPCTNLNACIYEPAEPNAQRWTLTQNSDGTYSLQNVAIPAFLTSCVDCIQGSPAGPNLVCASGQSAEDPNTRWIFNRLANGKWTLQHQQLKTYLNRCAGCVTSINQRCQNSVWAFITDPTQVFAQWDIVKVNQ